MRRFADKCHFDATTGCVLWQGGLTNGQGSTSIYGVFWFEGKRWSAHRWAAKFIHGLDIDQEATHVDHCCPSRPNTLCMQHVQVVPDWVNLRLRWSRFWEYWADSYGLSASEEEPPITDDPPEFAPVPFYEPPQWLKDLYGNDEETNDSCPF